MIVAFGSDEETELTRALVAELRRQGHDVVRYGAQGRASEPWPAVGRAVGKAVARGAAACGIVCCWTGTGVSIAANVLALSNRATAVPVALEILEAWFETSPSEATDDRRAIADVEAAAVLRAVGPSFS